MRANFTTIVDPLPSTVPFVGPEHQERARGSRFRARIGANESVFGPSPKAIEAMRRAAPEVWMYCDPNIYDLKHALAAHHGVPPEAVVVGEGIDGLFGVTNRLFVEPGCKVVTSLGAYPTFNFHVAGHGGELITVPFVGDGEDPESLLAACRQHRPRLVYLSNPNNPMGSWHDAAAVQALIDALPSGTLLCLDEAYVEFAPEGTAPALDISNPQVLRFRTFSKAYGMAGLRVGYVIAHPEVALAYDRIRNHFGVNRVAQEAALAALADQEHLAWVQGQVATARRSIGEIAACHSLTALPSATNFVAIDCGRDGDFARAILAGLIARDVFVRMPGVAPQDRCIRVSAGTEADLTLFDAALGEVLAELR